LQVIVLGETKELKVQANALCCPTVTKLSNPAASAVARISGRLKCRARNLGRRVMHCDLVACATMSARLPARTMVNPIVAPIGSVQMLAGATHATSDANLTNFRRDIHPTTSGLRRKGADIQPHNRRYKV
jgi:hypothetical protein